MFYAGLLYGEYTKDSFRALQVQCDLELYNGGYVYQADERKWYQMDSTPFPTGEVPKALLASILLLT